MRKPRRAKLTIEGPGFGPDHHWVRMRAKNGEVIFHTEMYATFSKAERSRAAIIRSMVDVVTEDGAGLQLVVSRLREMGYTVTRPQICADCGKQFDEPSAFEDEDICPKCANEMAAEEAGR